MIEKNFRIDKLYISKNFFEMVDTHRCDCGGILIRSYGQNIELCHYIDRDDGYITFETVEKRGSEYVFVVDFGDKNFYLDGIQTRDDGLIDGIRFRSGNLFLFLLTDEEDLVLTQTTLDLFEEAEGTPPRERDIPPLKIMVTVPEK